jgi:hypothetical protein
MMDLALFGRFLALLMAFSLKWWDGAAGIFCQFGAAVQLT